MSLALLLFWDHIAQLIPQPFSFRESIGQWSSLDGQKSLFQTFVEEVVAGLVDNHVGDLVDIRGSKVVHDVDNGVGHHLGSKVADGTLCDGRDRMMNRSIELLSC